MKKNYKIRSTIQDLVHYSLYICLRLTGGLGGPLAAIFITIIGLKIGLGYTENQWLLGFVTTVSSLIGVIIMIRHISNVDKLVEHFFGDQYDSL